MNSEVRKCAKENTGTGRQRQVVPELRIRLCNCESVLLMETMCHPMTRRSIAMTYRLAMEQEKDADGEKIDWSKVNAAIIKRWSVSGLEYIKRLAWSGKCFTGVNP